MTKLRARSGSNEMSESSTFTRCPARRTSVLAMATAEAPKSSSSWSTVVVTSMIESAIGVAQAVHVAAAAGREVAHGVATSSLLADDVAYVNHDLQDGLQAGLLTVEQIIGLPIVGDCFRAVDRQWPDLDPTRRRYEALRRVFGQVVEDLLAESARRLKRAAPETIGPP